MGILQTEFALIWSTPWTDEKELFFEICYSRNSQFFAVFLGEL